MLFLVQPRRHQDAGGEAVTERLRVVTLNIHKGLSQFNRRMVLHELREGLRGLEPDVVFLQEVQGTHEKHPGRHASWPEAPHYEFLADSIWPEFAYGARRAP